jgi:hypothetical protein
MDMAILFAVFAGVYASNAIAEMPTSYDDCVLSHVADAKTREGVQAIKTACKNKYPKTFDFDAIARQANVDPWGTVVRKQEFQSKSIDIKNQIRREYFDEVIKPRVHPDFVVESRTQFEAFALGIEQNYTVQQAH